MRTCANVNFPSVRLSRLFRHSDSFLIDINTWLFVHLFIPQKMYWTQTDQTNIHHLQICHEAGIALRSANSLFKSYPVRLSTIICLMIHV